MKLAQALVLATLPQYVAAQTTDDAAVCTRLLQSYRSGLYLAYPAPFATPQPTGRTICEAGSGFCVSPVTGRPDYNPSARFYFLPGNGNGRAREGVWHIRTQTRAANLSGADFAFVYRPSIRTRCSPDFPLDAFIGDSRLVPLNRYMDHHPGTDDARRPDPGLGRYFHFYIQDPPDTKNCIRTDNAQAFRNLRKLYGFDGVVRTEQQVARFFLFTSTAIADVATQYAGLSSEFAYHDGAGPVCFGFSVPTPTLSRNFDATQNWKPLQTSIVIKQLIGRRVSETEPRTITWAP